MANVIYVQLWLALLRVQELTGKPVHKVGAIHAGLECGLIGGKFPGMDAVGTKHSWGAHNADLYSVTYADLWCGCVVDIAY
jgi:hypothetical protein